MNIKKPPKFLEFYGASTGARNNKSKVNCKVLQGTRRTDGRQASGHVDQEPMGGGQRPDLKVKRMTKQLKCKIMHTNAWEWTNQWTLKISRRMSHDITNWKWIVMELEHGKKLQKLKTDENTRLTNVAHWNYDNNSSIKIREWTQENLTKGTIIVTSRTNNLTNLARNNNLTIPIKGSIEKGLKLLEKMAAWYHERELKANVRGTQEIPTIFRGLRDGDPEGLFVAESITVGDAYTNHKKKYGENAGKDDLILELPMVIPSGTRPHNSLLLEANDVEKIKESFVKTGCLGHVKWNCDSKKKVHWVQFVFKKHWCCYIRLYPRMISDLDPIKEFVTWDFMQMACIVLKKPGDKDENNEMVEKHRMVYNSSWPIEAMMKEIITKHYERWQQDEHDLLVEMMRNPRAKVSTKIMCRPNKDDYSINAFIKDRPDLKSWADEFRDKDRLRQAQKYKASLKMPQWGGVDEKFTDIYSKVQTQAEQLELILAERTREQTRMALMEKERMERELKRTRKPDEENDSAYAQSNEDKAESVTSRALPKPDLPFNKSATPNSTLGKNSKMGLENLYKQKLDLSFEFEDICNVKYPDFEISSVNFVKAKSHQATPVPSLDPAITPTPTQASRRNEESVEISRMDNNIVESPEDNIFETIENRYKDNNTFERMNSRNSINQDLNMEINQERDNKIFKVTNRNTKLLYSRKSQKEFPRGYDPTKLTEEEEDEEIQMCAMRSVASKANSSAWDVKWSCKIDGLDDDKNEETKVTRINEWINQTQERTKDGRHTGKYSSFGYSYSKNGEDDISVISGISINNSNYAPSGQLNEYANSSITSQYAPVAAREWDFKTRQEISLTLPPLEDLEHTTSGPKESTPARKNVRLANTSIKGTTSRNKTNQSKKLGSEPAGAKNEEYDAKTARTKRLKNIQAKAREQADKDKLEKEASMAKCREERMKRLANRNSRKQEKSMTKRPNTTPVDKQEERHNQHVSNGQSKVSKYASFKTRGIITKLNYSDLSIIPLEMKQSMLVMQAETNLKGKIGWHDTVNHPRMNAIIKTYFSVENQKIKMQLMRKNQIPNQNPRSSVNSLNRDRILIYTKNRLLEIIFPSELNYNNFQSLGTISKIINTFYNKPSVVTFMHEGRCRILDGGGTRGPVVMKNDVVLRPQEWNKWIWNKVANYIEENKGFYARCNAKWGRELIDEQSNWLKAFTKSRMIKEGIQFEKENVQELDDLNLAGKEHLTEANEWLGLNSLPTTLQEEEMMNKWRIKTGTIIKEMEKRRNEIASRFKLQEWIREELKENEMNFKKSFLKKKKAEESEVEKPRIEGNEENEKVTPQGETEPVYHHWYDGEEIKLERKKVPEEEFKKAEEIEKQEKKEINLEKRLKIGYANIPIHKARNNDFNVLQELVDEYDEIDIWMLCELYYNGNGTCQIPEDYEMVTHDLLEEKNTMILYKKEIADKIQKRKSNLLESRVTVNMNGDKNAIDLIAFYRGPSRKKGMFKQQELIDEMKKLGDEHVTLEYVRWMSKIIHTSFTNKDCLLAGDFNLKLHQDLNNKQASKVERLGQELMRDAFENQWPNLLKNENTRKDKSGLETSIDVIATNVPDRVLRYKRLDPGYTNKFSDHYIWTMDLDLNIQVERSCNIQAKKKIDWTTEWGQNESKEINKLLKKALKDELDESKNVERALENFAKACREALPVKTVKAGLTSAKLNFNLELFKLKKERQDYMEKEGITGLGGFYTRNFPRLKAYNREIEKKKNQSRLDYWKRKIKENQKAGGMWKLLKVFKNRKTKLPDFVNCNSTARFFCDLSWNYKPLNKKLIIRGNCNSENKTVNPRKLLVTGKFQFTRLDSVKSTDYWKNLKSIIKDGKGSDYAYAPDGTTLHAMKMLDDEGWDLLSRCVDELIRTGRYIKMFRDQKSVPVPKKPVIEIMKHIRPVTVSSALANIFEKVLAKMFYAGCETKGWFDKDQYGFRSSYSIGYLISNMKKYIARRKCKFWAVCQTDQSNAFGSPDIEGILEELNSRLSDGAFDLVKSFLLQSSAKVMIEGKESVVFKTAPRGFAQGSCWSPVMFVTLMTGSHNEVTAIGLTFADDASYIINEETKEEMILGIQHTVKEFQGFCERLNIKLNVSKTFYLNSTGENYKIHLEGDKLNHQKTMNMLGVRMDKNLSVDPQVQYIKNKIRGLRHLIGTFGQSVRDEKTQGTLAKSYVIGTFNHGSQYINKWCVSKYNSFQSSLNKALTRKTGYIMQKEMLDNKIENKTILKEVKLAIQRKDKIKEKYYLYNIINIPQWILLDRHKMSSVENIHRMNWITRMTKLIKTARPETEFEELMKHLTDNFRQARRSQRSSSRFPYFKETLGEDQVMDRKMLKNTAPSIWIREFLKLPEDLKISIMSDRLAVERVKTFYKNRCQHHEKKGELCSGCNQSTLTYRDTQIEIKINEWQNRDEQEMEYINKLTIYDGENWILADEELLEDLNEDNLVAIDWGNPSERINTLEGLGLSINTELKELLEHIQKKKSTNTR